MSRDGKQRFRQFLDIGQQKILDILTCKNDRGILFAHALGSVANIFNSCEVGQEKIQLINGCCGISFGQQFVVHEGQDVEQHCILQFFVSFHETLDSETNKPVIGDVGVSVEELAFRTDTHGVQPKTEFAEQIFCEKRFRSFLVLHILALHNLVQVSHYGIIPGSELRIIRVIMDAEFAVEPCQEDFKRIDLRIIKILVDPEEVLQKRDVLREACCFAECFRCIVLGITCIVRPLFWFKRVDDILSAHEVDITPAEIVA